MHRDATASMGRDEDASLGQTMESESSKESMGKGLLALLPSRLAIYLFSTSPGSLSKKKKGNGSEETVQREEEEEEMEKEKEEES